MPELSITESQRDRLDDVRQEVESAYVETYGETRPQDAIEYLLDTYTPPEQRAVVAAYEEVATATYPTLQQIASDVDEVPGSGIEAAEMRGRLLAALGPESLAERLRAVGTETDDDVSTADDSASDSELDSDSPPEAPAESPADENSPTTTGESSQGESETDTNGAEESTPPSPLASVNKLLDDHSEKWRKGDGDAPYEVDLPDGTTEAARTKDDVRQLLFRHY